MSGDEYFDESMVPLKKFSEYEAEAWETGSHKSEESRQTVDVCTRLLRGVSAPGSIERPGGVIGLIDKVARGAAGDTGVPRPNDLLQDMTHAFGVHQSFISSPATNAAAHQALFGIAHYAGPVSYDVRNFVAKDVDTLDPGVLNVLRQSSEPFIEKLIAGPAVRGRG